MDESHVVVPEYTSKNFLVKNLFVKRLEIAANLCEKYSNLSVLDVGCGDGTFEKYLLNFFPESSEIVGIDLLTNVENLKIGSCKFVKEDIVNISNSHFDKYDIIFCLDVLEHIKPKFFESAITNVVKCLKKNGQLILSGPTESFIYKLGRFVTKGHWDSKFDNQDIHYRNVYDIENAFCSSGLFKNKTKLLPNLLLSELSLFRISLFIKS